MNSQDRVRMLSNILENHGRSSMRTVNPADPTMVRTQTMLVAMEYGFGADSQQEPPEPEIVEFKAVSSWGMEVTIKSKSLYIQAFFDEKWMYIGDPTRNKYLHISEEGFREKGERLEKVLDRILFEGVWGVKKTYFEDRAEAEEMEHAMGCNV